MSTSFSLFIIKLMSNDKINAFKNLKHLEAASYRGWLWILYQVKPEESTNGQK